MYNYFTAVHCENNVFVTKTSIFQFSLCFIFFDNLREIISNHLRFETLFKDLVVSLRKLSLKYNIYVTIGFNVSFNNFIKAGYS